MRKIVGRTWIGDEDGEFVDAVVEIDRTDDDEVAINAYPLYGDESPSLYFNLYEAHELVDALNDARRTD